MIGGTSMQYAGRYQDLFRQFHSISSYLAALTGYRSVIVRGVGWVGLRLRTRALHLFARNPFFIGNKV